jgi:hypothetical protein
VFVLGANPFQLSDGSGVPSDSKAVKQELAQWSDFVRVPTVHQPGSEGRSQLMHELWKRLPLQHIAQFYVKAQVRPRVVHPPRRMGMRMFPRSLARLIANRACTAARLRSCRGTHASSPTAHMPPRRQPALLKRSRHACSLLWQTCDATAMHSPVAYVVWVHASALWRCAGAELALCWQSAWLYAGQCAAESARAGGGAGGVLREAAAVRGMHEGWARCHRLEEPVV